MENTTLINTSNSQLSNDLWWSLNLATKQYKCSEHIAELCGVNLDNFVSHDFMLLVHHNHQEQLRAAMHNYFATNEYEEYFQILTRFGYCWVHSKSEYTTLDEQGATILHGKIRFLSNDDVALRHEREVQQQLKELINRYTSVSSSLLELLHKSDTSTVILKTLDNLLEEFNGDRAYIFEYDLSQQTQNCIYEVVRDTAPSAMNRLQNLPLCATPRWTEVLLFNNTSIIVDDLEQIRTVASDEYEMLRQQNIQSLIIVPLFTKNGVGGYLGIYMVNKKHTWSDTDRMWLQSLSNIISLCIELKKSEETARKEREQYKSLYENMPIGFMHLKMIYDKDGTLADYLYLEVNSLAYNFAELTNNNITGKLHSQLCGEVPQDRMDLFDNLLKTREVYRTKVAGHNGQRYFDYTIYPVEKAEIIVLIHDDTESVMATRALRKSEQTLQNIYNNIPVGIEIYDKNGILIGVNDMEQEIFGFSDKEEVLGTNLFNNPNIPESFLEELRNQRTASCDFYYNFDNVHNYYTTLYSGRRHIVLKGSVLYDSDHNVENYLLIILDNTDSLQANHKIHEFETLFNSIAEFSELGMCQWNPQDNTIFGTDQWYLNLGQENRVFTDIMEAYSKAHPMDIARIKQEFADIASGKINSFRREIRIRDGKEWKWLRSNYKVSESRLDKNKTEIIGINIDITELKETEMKLTEAKIKAEESDRLKSAFLANMSHEIRTPLNAIVGFSDLLTETDDADECRQYISIIRQNNDLLLQLISDILDISKIESGMIAVNPEPIDINELCQEVVRSHELKVLDGVQLTFETPEVECMIITDKNRLIQVMGNLINNSLKFTEHGDINLGYIKHADHVEFYVRDTGIGIPSDKISTIFTRFIKLNSFISGTGLGLPICKSLLEKMGGRIWAESEFGKGSCFRFVLPYNASETIANIAIAQPQAPERTTLLVGKPVTRTKPTIVVAEDTDSNYILVSTILKNEYNLVRAYNGLDAIDKFKIHSPDLILMDMKMPQMGGIEATVKIKALDPDINIIMITAFAFDNDRQRALDAGCCDFITKPIHADELKAAIEKYLS